ncbi:hypothetical protein Zmor_012420 [Zophobas morio]|uniref:DNA replication ATP-dependent helicase/nuclease n=1 Tax=Zophobas morio TaxID=2755281 RepID=A0AA38LZ55_9CUCU|nr:hypothetical protein Zmor_012420 [Zophobas morio]
MIVLYPDRLVSITRVTEGISCLRKAVLGEKLKGLSLNEDVLFGTILHEIFEKALIHNNFSNIFLKNTLTHLLLQRADELIAIDAIEHRVYDNIGNPSNANLLKVTRILHTEEGYWSPMYGLKGKIDATVVFETLSGEQYLAPLEFKTKNPSQSKSMITHRGQVILYTMLMNSRYGNVSKGYLYYLSEKSLVEVTCSSVRGTYFKDEFIVYFKRIDHTTTSNKNKLLFTAGDFVVLSTMENQYGLATGYVKTISKFMVSIRVKNPFLKRGNALFRLDKCENNPQPYKSRDNLMRLMKPGVELYQNLRQLVIDKRAPEFYDESEVPFKLSSKFFIELNESQRNVIRKVVYSKDYALVLGMPGGGKTTVIAHIIKQLAFSGKSVLVASYTHTAVDNILLKLIELGASTCFGINHPLLMMRTFDYCIIDEASQITLPTILGPLLCSRKFVLVGDHNQLPPLVKCSKAALMGLQETLFKILTQAHPRSMTELVYQYRMNSDISLISSHLIYDYRLKCATPSTAAKHLVLKIPVSFAKSIIALYLIYSLLFVVEISDNLESFNACGILNVFESKLASFLALALIKCGVSAGNVGIITPYHSQTLLIKENLIKSEFLSTLEVFTIDKYQGKDKLVIILSFVRSNSLSLVGSLLEDSRRLNVAFTRAKEKVAILKQCLRPSIIL